MKKLMLILIFSLSFGSTALSASQLIEELKIFEPFTEKTWVHQTGQSGSPDYFHDVIRWSVIMGGNAILTEHSVNEGVYGGYTLIFYDQKTDIIRCTYVTTGGFYTECTMKEEEGGIVILETVKGTRRGPKAVRSMITLEGELYIIKSQYQIENDWSKEEVRSYHEDAEALVVFE
jgi:hypothetical protein